MFSNFPTLHPAIVHFPIVLLLLTGLFGLISLFSKNEIWNILAIKSLIGGVISSPIAVITGFIEEQKMNHSGVDEMLMFHKFNGLTIVFFFQFLFVWYWLRKLLMSNKEYKLWVMCLLVGNCLVILQGYIGGELVFSKGMGVKPVEESMNSSSGGHHGEGEKKIEDRKMNKPKEKESKNEIQDMDDKKDKHDIKGMDDTKGSDTYIINGNFYQYKMKDNGSMKDIKSSQKANGKDNMKDMNMTDGGDNMKEMDKTNMKDSKEMGDMKAKNGMKNIKGMEDMKGMNMNNAMDTFKFKDNNPSRKAKKK